MTKFKTYIMLIIVKAPSNLSAHLAILGKKATDISLVSLIISPDNQTPFQLGLIHLALSIVRNTALTFDFSQIHLKNQGLLGPN